MFASWLFSSLGTPIGNSMSIQEFRDRVNGVPGLQENDTVKLLGLCGVHTWDQLGALAKKDWLELLQFIPQKRIEVPEDLVDVKRFGGGHMNSLDELRAQAKHEWDRKQKVEDKITNQEQK